MTSETKPRLVIFDTDMGADDAWEKQKYYFKNEDVNILNNLFSSKFRWALQMMLKAEKDLGNVKILAITTANGNTMMDNVIKNTFRILHGLNRTDVRWIYCLIILIYDFILLKKSLYLLRFRFTKAQQNQSELNHHFGDRMVLVMLTFGNRIFHAT